MNSGNVKYGRSGMTKVKVVYKTTRRSRSGKWVGSSVTCYKKGLFDSTYKYCKNKTSNSAYMDATRMTAGKYYEKHCC